MSYFMYISLGDKMVWKSNINRLFWLFFWIIVSIVIAVVAVGILVSFIAPASAYGPNYGYYGMMGGYRGFWVFGPIFMIIPVIIFFLFIYWIIELTTRNDRFEYNNPSTDALEILNYRYAKGEITEEQYQKMKNEILKR